MSQHTYTLRLQCRKDFDFEKTLKLRPFLLFYDDVPSRGFVLSHKRLYADFRQKGSEIFVEITCEKKLVPQEIKFMENRLAFCIGCEETMDGFYTLVEQDPVLKRNFDSIFGTRVFSAYDEFEALACIICSQNTSFSNYRRLVRRLMDAYNDSRFFPTPLEIVEAPEKLECAGLGYRVEYLLELARFFFRKGRFYVPHEVELSRLRGIGSYSISIYRLVQLRDYSVFYFDRLIRNILLKRYNYCFEKEREARGYLRRKFNGYVGLAELYLQMFDNVATCD